MLISLARKYATLAILLGIAGNTAFATRIDPTVTDTTEMGATATFSPVIYLGCYLYQETGQGLMPEHICEPAQVYSISSLYIATTTLLLKEVRAAQPDALNYVAGAAPTPALYSVIEKLQEFSSEELGQELSFDEAVNDIIQNI